MTKKKGITLIVIVSVLVLAITLAVSYAYWSVTKKGTQENVVSSGCFDMEITGERNAINLQNSYPLADSEVNGLTPYTFTIKNTCSIFASYSINLEALEGSTLNTNYVAVKVNNETKNILGSLPSATKSESSSVEARTIITGALGVGDEVEYTVRIWMDESVTLEDDAQDKTFIGKIVLEAEPSDYSPVNKGITLLNEALLVNEYQIEDVNEAKTRIQAKGEPDTTKTAPIVVWQETDWSDGTIFVRRPDISIKDKYSLNDNFYKLSVATNYSFNSETGYYSITDFISVDPATADYENNNYYICESGLGVNASNQLLINDYESCNELKKIKRLDSITDNTINIGGSIEPSKHYNFLVEIKANKELESDTSDKGLYAVKDDYSTDTNGVVSYVYRGNVKNNYVKFAGFYWKVIRINGDGGIRMIYAGDSPNSESLSINDGTLYKFNNVKSNPGHVGYMYGSTLNQSYEKTHANEVESYIKKQLIDPWYKTNIADKELSKYIADSGFCNDRSIIGAGGGVNVANTSIFGGYNRFINTKQATLICPNPDNDLFTTESSSMGNKALKYPVGLITIDELMLAGMVNGTLNKLSYVYSPNSYWTFSPYSFYGRDAAAIVFYLISDGSINGTWTNLLRGGVRPVINLKADTTITGGTGTANDPFIVDTSV